jgi:hypothetical protein
MPRFFLTVAWLLGGLVWSQLIESQAVSEDETERPDSTAHAGLRQDALIAPGTFEASCHMDIFGYEGINLRFPEGRLGGSRIGIELIIPIHEDLEGPQLTPSSGVALHWGMAFWERGPLTGPLESGGSASSPGAAQERHPPRRHSPSRVTRHRRRVPHSGKLHPALQLGGPLLGTS